MEGKRRGEGGGRGRRGEGGGEREEGQERRGEGGGEREEERGRGKGYEMQCSVVIEPRLCNVLLIQTQCKNYSKNRNVACMRIIIFYVCARI